MARSKQSPQYLLEEPVTGLYVAAGEAPRLTSCRAEAAHFSLISAALASSEFAAAGTPHELVRYDP